MKLLFDENLSFRLCTLLSSLFPGSTQVRLVGLERASDLEVWHFARTNGYAIVTQDGDFGDLATLLGSPPQVVWLRFGNQPTAEIERLLRYHADSILALEADPTVACLEVY